MRDAFEPLKVHDAIHGQRQAGSKEYQTHIEPPTEKYMGLKEEHLFRTRRKSVKFKWSYSNTKDGPDNNTLNFFPVVSDSDGGIIHQGKN